MKVHKPLIIIISLSLVGIIGSVICVRQAGILPQYPLFDPYEECTSKIIQDQSLPEVLELPALSFNYLPENLLPNSSVELDIINYDPGVSCGLRYNFSNSGQTTGRLRITLHQADIANQFSFDPELKYECSNSRIIECFEYDENNAFVSACVGLLSTSSGTFQLSVFSDYDIETTSDVTCMVELDSQ